MRLIDFAPPIFGIHDRFNTFRLGLFYSKCLKEGEVVGLVDNKAKLLLGRATVTDLDVGQLDDMLKKHARKNHTQLAAVSDEEAILGLDAIIKRLYGPHIATLLRKTTVIHLERLPNG